MKNSVIIVSGGMDSITMLYEYQETIALGISFDYGSNHNAKEIPLAEMHCERWLLVSWIQRNTKNKNMKRFFISFIAMCLCIVASAQVKVEVSETVELMAILSRTAGYREYSMDLGGKYTEETEVWFGKYKKHPTVVYWQGMKPKYGIGYDAVMSMAVHLAVDGKTVKRIGEKSDLEKRWAEVDVDAFMEKLNQFYRDTKFHEFFVQHKAFYTEGLKAYNERVMPYFHQDWYAKFYGTEPTERFGVIIGFTNGGGNYGSSRQLVGQPKEVFAICGYAVNAETGGVFEDGKSYASTLIHEFNHSFVNPLMDDAENQRLLLTTGKFLYTLSRRAMMAQAYSNETTVLNESVVRAAVILYMQENGFDAKAVGNELSDQISCGFNWMPELLTVLRYYTKNRDTYKTLKDYYPEVAKCLNEYVTKERQRIMQSL